MLEETPQAHQPWQPACNVLHSPLSSVTQLHPDADHLSQFTRANANYKRCIHLTLAWAAFLLFREDLVTPDFVALSCVMQVRGSAHVLP